MFSYTARLFLEILFLGIHRVKSAITESYTYVCIVFTEEHEIITIPFHHFIQDKAQFTKYK